MAVAMGGGYQEFGKNDEPVVEVEVDIYCGKVGAVTHIVGCRCNQTVIVKGDGIEPAADEYGVPYSRPCPKRNGCEVTFEPSMLRIEFPVQEIFVPKKLEVS